MFRKSVWIPIFSKARKYVNTEDLGLPTSLARFPNLANSNVYR